MGDAGFIDYSNPEAVSWVQQKFYNLFEQGIAVIKVDFGEGAPPDAVYHSVPGSAMHNLYPLLYNKAIFEATETFWGKDQAMVWARSAWAGSQRYPVHWSGDGVARTEDMACVLRSALNFGLSGFPFYSHDIGGFSGLPSPELYVRWAQFGLFSSHARAHGTPPREPWAYGETAEAIFRRYDELRYRLLPYIYSEAVECGRTSLPMVRAQVVDFQADPTSHTIDDAFLFGRHLLIAPVLDDYDRRQVYLPPGQWIDYWTKSVYHGSRWVTVDAPLAVLPIFVKAGAIIPHGPVIQYVDAQPCSPLTLEIYQPLDEGLYVIHDQSHPDVVVSYRRRGSTFIVTAEGAPDKVELVVFGIEVSGVTVNDVTVEWDERDDGGVQVNFIRAGQVSFQLAADTTQ
jgi:alpha-D-xyloside xylohydrolase